MNDQKQYVIGVDFGTDSVRSVLIDTHDGAEITSVVHHYSRWANQEYCNPSINQFRQHPLDHLEGLEFTIANVVKEGGVESSLIKGICVDTTGSSPMPLNKEGISLAMTNKHRENPNAMVVLWKDHTAVGEAAEINALASTWGGEDFTKFEGGIYSSEWFWAKIWHVIRQDEQVKKDTHTWMEHCDWVSFVLSDVNNIDEFKRSRCAAGHKAMWHESWNGLPPKEFLSKMDPALAELRDRLYEDTFTSDQVAGHLNEEWAKKLGLSTETVIAVGTFDAHAGAVGAKIDKNMLVRVMGTSTCDIIVSSSENIGNKTVNGICGQVDGSVIPGMIGLEAGQSAFGDLLAWFTDILRWPLENLMKNNESLSEEQKEALLEDFNQNIINDLAAEAEKIPAEEAVPTALDWINGRRTPDANQELKGAMSNLSLGTKAPHLFRAMVDAICFGSKKIVDRFEEEGVQIDSVVGIGGVARKSPFIMQALANVLDKPIKVAASDQTPALGAAVYAAVASGIYPNVIEAASQMGSDYEAEYTPQPEQVGAYQKLLAEYDKLCHFEEFVNRKK